MSKLFVERRGQGPDLVLLHGWGMNSGVWRGVSDLLAQRFTLHLVDLPGHGQSRDVLCETLPGMAQAVRSVVPADAHWIAWSLGAMVALQVEGMNPGSLRALTCVAGTPRFVQGVDWPHAVDPELLVVMARELAADSKKMFDRFLALQVMGCGSSRESLSTLRESIPMQGVATQQALDNGLRILAETDLRSDLAAVKIPLSFIFGEKDRLVMPACAEQVRIIVPAADIHIVKGAGHAPFVSHPAEFVEHITCRVGV